VIATAHQTAYWPWLGYVHKIASADVFVLLDDLPHDSGSYENRNKILGPNGPQWLTVPVRHSKSLEGHDGTPVRQVEIANEHDWRRKHMRSIELSYSGCPEWKTHEPYLRWLYAQNWPTLVGLNDAILNYLLRTFAVTTKVQTQSKLGVTTAKNQLLVDVCKKVGAWKFLFGAVGADYVDAKAFADAGVEAMIQTYTGAVYPQNGRLEFISKLSSLDLLLNVPREKAREIMASGGIVGRIS
jgi:hypothetical protein